MTLTFVPKLIAVGLGIAFFGPWMISTLIEFATGMFNRIPTLFF
jgi:flagellar biosynthetic protein FliQ